jgi:hypothetical protein
LRPIRGLQNERSVLETIYRRFAGARKQSKGNSWLLLLAGDIQKNGAASAGCLRH